MNVRPLTDESALLRITPAWRGLVARAARPEVVVSPAWALAWWHEFGGDGRRLAALAVEDDGRLVGLALLASRRVLHRRLVPIRRLELWMTGEPHAHEVWSKYVGFVAERGREAAVTRALAHALASGLAGRFDELLLTRLSSDDPLLPPLVEALGGAGFGVTTERTSRCPYARLPGTWEEYLGALDERFRSSIEQGLAELERWAEGRPIELHVATIASARRGLDELRRLEDRQSADRGQANVFASERFSRFHDVVVPRLIEDGHLDLMWLSVGETPVAALYNLVVDGRSQVYQSGQIALGAPRHLPLAMHARAIQRAIRRGDREYDFLGARAPHELHLSTDERSLVDVVARSAHLRGRAAAAAARGLDRAVARARPWLSRRAPPPPVDDDAWPAR